eukprot:1160633-Pelagomonas_calceolata.AAC.11
MHRWRFKVTEWRLGKLQWGQDAPPPLPAEQPRHPNPTQSLSICAGQEGFQKHGISTDYAVSVQPEALHGSKALHRGVPSSVLVSVYGKPPGRLVHILPSFLQHLARCSAAQIAVEDLSGDVRSFSHNKCSYALPLRKEAPNQNAALFSGQQPAAMEVDIILGSHRSYEASPGAFMTPVHTFFCAWLPSKYAESKSNGRLLLHLYRHRTVGP